MKFKAAAVQMDCALRDVDANLAKARSLIDGACADGATLVAVPELFATGYRLDEDYHKFAETIPGPTTDFLTSLARAHNAYIAGSLIEEATVRGVIYNTEVLVGPEGLVGKQAKIILYHREKLYFAAGDVAVPYDTALGKIGLMICRDIGFPEIARALTLKGAEILICSSAAGSIGVSTQARAADNSAYLVASNRIGKELDTNLGGDSRIIDPSGKVMAEAGKEEGYCIAELDTDFIVETRNRRRNLQDYRPSLFLNPGFYR
jgi:predicted amidohydrolase